MQNAATFYGRTYDHIEFKQLISIILFQLYTNWIYLPYMILNKIFCLNVVHWGIFHYTEKIYDLYRTIFCP